MLVRKLQEMAHSDLSENKRALLARYLRGERSWSWRDENAAIPRRTTGDTAPLSFAQQRLWFLEQLEPGSSAYLIPLTRRLQGALNVGAIARALKALVQRHEILRTTFQIRDGQPLQIIHAVAADSLLVIDLRALPQQVREIVGQRLARQENSYPCDLARGPLLRVRLLRLESQAALLLITLHHIVSDGWSNDIFFREFTQLYQIFAGGHSASSALLPPLPIQYADFAIWQRQWLQGEVLQTQLAYWKDQLEGIVPLELPTDRPRPPVQTLQGKSHIRWLPSRLHSALLSLSQSAEATLFMLLLTAFLILLDRYTGQHDIAVGSPVAGRTRRELEGLIGFFVNTLVLRCDLAGNPTFLEALQRTREVVLGAHAHQDMPFEHLVEILQPERDLSRSPLFQVMFSVQQIALFPQNQDAPLPDRSSRENAAFALTRESAATSVKFDLEMHLMSGKQGLRCAVAYRTDLFDAETIDRLIEHFCTLLQSIVAQPEQRIASLALLTPAERQLLLIERNATRRAYPLQRLFARHFSDLILRVPQRVAFVHKDHALTYGELHRLSNQFARYLLSQGIGPEALVGVAIERSLEMVIVLLGIFKAGAAYLPLDPATPPQRLLDIVEDASLRLLIASPGVRASLPMLNSCVIRVEEGGPFLDNYSAQEPQPSEWPEQSDQLAYVIYTSGSTGKPKGAMVAQRGMLNHLLAKIEELQLGDDDIVAQTASHCFDISVWQFLAALLSGAQVHIFPDEITHDPQQLLLSLARESVSIAEVVPSLLRALLDLIEAQAEMPATSLRSLIVTGEALPVELGQRWLRLYPSTLLLNAYGPTECSDDVTHARLTPANLPGGPHAPIGQAIANTRIYVLDETLEPVPDGIPGQIYIGGIGVGRGYLGDPARTAATFLPDPFGDQAGARLYRTGDLGRYRRDGLLDFVRRLDQQVKVRGYRVEPGDVEMALQCHPGVREAVVLAQEDRSHSQQLVAYVVCQEDATPRPDGEMLREYLRGRLPEYMLPAAVLFLPALPLTGNGKLDRRALPIPQLQNAGDAHEEEQAEKTPIEEMLLALWCEVLGRTRIGLQENFFHLGGHSLLATQVISRVQALFKVELPLRSLFEAPTVVALAARVKAAMSNGRGMETPPLIQAPRPPELPLSFAQQRLWFLDRLEPGNTAYLIPRIQRFSGELNISLLERSLEQLIRRHESLRTIFRLRGDQPMQVILPELVLQVPLIDLRAFDRQRRAELSRRIAREEASQPCDLANGPLLRVRLLRLESEEHILLLTMHHIISDGWSLQVLLRDLRALYLALVAGQSPALAPLPVQYADYALWQRQWLQGAVLEEYLAYWREQLEGAPALELPTDRPRPPVQSYHGAARGFTFSDELALALTVLAQQEGVTLFMFFLAAFQVLLSYYSRQEEIVIGTDVANRNRSETEGLIGFFVNQLVLRGRLGGDPSFRALLRQARETALGAYTYQDLPFERLVEELRPERDLSYTPLFQVKLVLQNVPIQPQAESGPVSLTTQSLSPELQTAKFDLILNIVAHPRRIAGWIEYNTDLFDEASVVEMIDLLTLVLRRVVVDPEQHLTTLQSALLKERAERQRRHAQELHRLSQHRLEQVRRKRQR